MKNNPLQMKDNFEIRNAMTMEYILIIYINMVNVVGKNVFGK